MKKVVLLSLLTIIILVSAGAIYVLNNPDCCSASETKNTNLNLSTHASPPEFKKALETGAYKLIDIRTIEEYNAGHLSKASQIDFYQTGAFDAYLNSLDKNAKYLIYCRSGNRSSQALQIMKEKGFVSVSDLSGGINAWNSYNLAIEK